MTELNTLDSRIFEPEALDPETVKFNKKLERLLSTMPPTHTRTPQEVREERESGKGWMGPIRRLDQGEYRMVPGQDHDVPIRVFMPDEVLGVYLHMHGGGFVLSHPDHFDEGPGRDRRKV